MTKSLSPTKFRLMLTPAELVHFVFQHQIRNWKTHIICWIIKLSSSSSLFPPLPKNVLIHNTNSILNYFVFCSCPMLKSQGELLGSSVWQTFGSFLNCCEWNHRRTQLEEPELIHDQWNSNCFSNLKRLFQEKKLIFTGCNHSLWPWIKLSLFPWEIYSLGSAIAGCLYIYLQ